MPRALEFPVREPRSLVLENGNLIHRGLRDITPKYLDLPKLAATLLRQIANNDLQSLDSTNILMPCGLVEAERLSNTFYNVSNFAITAPLLDTFFDKLHTVSGRTALVIATSKEANSSEQFMDFARSLNAHDRNLELGLAKDLISRARDRDVIFAKEQRHDKDAIIIEERGGKFGQLNLEEPTIRLQAKKWQNLVNSSAARDPKGPTKPPIEASGGFGAGAAIFCNENHKNQSLSRNICFSSSHVKLSDSLSVEVVAQIKNEIAHWLGNFDISIANLKRVYISTPFMSISSFIGQAFSNNDSSNPLLMYPDHIFGWQPLLTLLAMIRQPLLPAIFLHLGSGPTIQIAGVWAR